MVTIVDDPRREAVGIGLPHPTEFDAWSGLWQAYLQFYGAVRPAELYRHNWQRIQDPQGEIKCLLARRGEGKAAGLAHFLFHSTAWSAAPVCYLQDLFVTRRIAVRGWVRH